MHLIINYMALLQVFVRHFSVKCLSLFMFFALCSVNIYADSLNSEIRYCSNTSQELHIEQAIDCNYLQRNQLQFSQDFQLVRWVRVAINNEKPEQVAIYIAPHFLEKIELYERTSNRWLKQTAGSSLPSADPHTLIGGYYFVSEPLGAGNHYLYLKVIGSGLNNLNISVTKWPSLELNPANWQIGIGIQVGALLLILAFSVFSYWITPNLVMGRFCLLMIVLALCTLSGSGILAKLALVSHPELDGLIFFTLLALRMGLWVWVSEAFLKHYQTPKWYPYCCKIFYIAGISSIALTTLGFPSFGQSSLLAAYLLAPILQFIATIKTKNIKPRFQKTLAWGFAAATALVFLALFVNIYPFGERPLPTYVARLTDFVNPLILLYIIQFQARQIREDLNAANKLLAASNIEKEFERQLVAERQILIDMLTHELKNPLASISLAIGSLKRSFLPDDSSELRRIENITNSVKNMDDVIERVSYMNILDQQKIGIDKSDFSLNAFIDNLVANISPKSRISYSADTDYSIHTDQQFLKIILTNLIDNALKYSPQESQISIKVSATNKNNGSNLCIQVINSVLENLRPDPDKLFTRYYRHERANAISGSGLGLFLIHKITHILGGKIVFEQTSSNIIFSVILPND